MVSTHTPLQEVCPPAHAQTLAEHSLPAGQTVPQVPQLALSSASETQPLPQPVVPGGQVAVAPPPSEIPPEPDPAASTDPLEPGALVSVDAEQAVSATSSEIQRATPVARSLVSMRGTFPRRPKAGHRPVHAGALV